jgi:hypothetical protein
LANFIFLGKFSQLGDKKGLANPTKGFWKLKKRHKIRHISRKKKS